MEKSSKEMKYQFFFWVEKNSQKYTDPSFFGNIIMKISFNRWIKNPYCRQIKQNFKLMFFFKWMLENHGSWGGLMSSAILNSVWQNLIVAKWLGSKRWRKSESPKMTSKIIYERVTRSYEGFNYFSQSWNLTISKDTSVNNRKSKCWQKLNFNG